MTGLLILIMNAGIGSSNTNVSLEPPLGPIDGVFAAVAYWREGIPESKALFNLLSEDGVEMWQDETTFDLPWYRAAVRCDTSDMPEGVYRLVVQCGEETDAIDLHIQRGRERISGTRPFHNHMLWMPMTGMTEAQLDDAVSAGYDTIFLKGAPAYAPPGVPIDFSQADKNIAMAQERGMRVVLAWLLWTALPPGEFYLERRDGTHVMNRIEPCWDEAMMHVRSFSERLLDHYMGCRDILALAPTWGIYGEAGYAEFDAGYGPHVLQKYNRWRVQKGLSQVDTLPSPQPNLEHILFHRFRFEYLASVWGELNGHLRRLEPNGIAIGAWQEIYNGHMYSLALSEAPGADFAINEMCFPWGTTYDQQRAIGETMGVRYKCSGFEEYRDYYLPLIARRWAEGQQAIGCQLSNHYAESNYVHWPPGKAEEVAFDRWEDLFAPYIRQVRDIDIIEEPATIAYVQMTYPTAGYPDMGNTVTDINLYEIVLRMWGVNYDRIPITRLDRMTSADLAKYTLIIVPCAWYLDERTWLTLQTSGASLLLTGGVMETNGDHDGTRALDGMVIEYGATPAGTPELHTDTATYPFEHLKEWLAENHIELPADIGISKIDGGETLISIGDAPLLVRKDKVYIITNRLLFACAYNPEREIPHLSGSVDVSADEGDPWGMADSSSPANRFGELVLRSVIEGCGGQVRIPNPPSRHFSRYLSDHVERIGVTHNMVVNYDSVPHTIAVRFNYPVKESDCVSIIEEGTTLLLNVSVLPYDYVAVEPAS